MTPHEVGIAAMFLGAGILPTAAWYNFRLRRLQSVWVKAVARAAQLPRRTITTTYTFDVTTDPGAGDDSRSKDADTSAVESGDSGEAPTPARATPFDTGPANGKGEPHLCSFGDNCAVRKAEALDRLAREALR